MADAGTPAASVAIRANQSLSAFQQCLVAASAVHPRELSMVEDQLARFSTWASSIGVFAPGRASMDHRLRHTLDVQGVVMDLLESLTYRIEACTSILQSISDDSEIPQTQQLVDSFGNIANEISHLNKISNTIRKASKETQHLRASNFQIQDNEGNEIESLLLSHFKHYINDLFPSCSETLKGRLSNTMLLRRKRILYRRHRQGTTSIRLQEMMVQAVVALPSAQTEDTPTLRKHSHHGGATPSQVMTATTLASKQFKMVSSTPSVISASKTVALVNHQALTFPTAPGYILKQKFEALREKSLQEFHTSIVGGLRRPLAEAQLNMELEIILQNIGEIACPYCLYAIPAQEAFDERKWQQHVKNDLDPYICLFEHCNSENVLYSHSQEWLNHLRDHAKIWHCFSHPTLDPFTSRDDYIEHIRNVHGSTLNDSQLRALANKNSRKRVDLFPSCPLCGATATDVTGRMEDHITGHLRSIALKSLPAYEEDVPDDFQSTENSEQISDMSSRSTIRHGSFSGGDNDDEDAMDMGSPVTYGNHGESTTETSQSLSGLETIHQYLEGHGGVFEQQSNYKEDEMSITSDDVVTTMVSEKPEKQLEEQTEKLWTRSRNACLACRIRKQKCDGLRPCSPCVRLGLGCNGASKPPVASEDIDTEVIPGKPEEKFEEQSDSKGNADQIDPETALNYGISPPEPRLRKNSTTRSRTACLACRTRRLRCDEIHPTCGQCAAAKLDCYYSILHSDADKAPSTSEEPHITIIQEAPKPNLDGVMDSDAAPIQFTDCIGRKFNLPFDRCATRPDMDELIKQVFIYQDLHGRQVHEGFYDLLGPDGTIIPPSAWDQVIQPGLPITMSLWSLSRLPPNFFGAPQGLAPEDERETSPIQVESPYLDEDSDVAMPYDGNDQIYPTVTTEAQFSGYMERLEREMQAAESSNPAMEELKRGAYLSGRQSDPYPTTTRVLRKHVSLTALWERDIEFEILSEDEVVIKRIVPEWELEQLQEHTSKIRRGRPHGSNPSIVDRLRQTKQKISEIRELLPKTSLASETVNQSTEQVPPHESPQQPIQMNTSQMNPGDVSNNETNEFQQMDLDMGDGIPPKGEQAANTSNAGAREQEMREAGSSPQTSQTSAPSDSLELDHAMIQQIIPQLPLDIKTWQDLSIWRSHNPISPDTHMQLMLLEQQQRKAGLMRRELEELDEIEQLEQKARSRVHPRDDSQERKRPRIEELDRSDLDLASDSLERTSPMGEAGSSSQNPEQERLAPTKPVRKEKIKTRGRGKLKRLSPASNESTISSSPWPQPLPAQFSRSFEALDSLHHQFLGKWRPLCEEFLAAPPTDPDKREEEHRRLSESIMAQIIIKLDAVDTGGHEEIRNKRRAIVQEVEDTLRQLAFANKLGYRNLDPALGSLENYSPLPSAGASFGSPSNPPQPYIDPSETEEPISSSETAAVFACSEPGCTQSFDQPHKLE
ncbi:hypothetical protein VHEMI09043 [[Torrubiella] hemipterigena]|nr:hypothetical protein VHEMI09043 [[Torrubiella] hemipterigena]